MVRRNLSPGRWAAIDETGSVTDTLVIDQRDEADLGSHNSTKTNAMRRSRIFLSERQDSSEEGVLGKNFGGSYYSMRYRRYSISLL